MASLRGYGPYSQLLSPGITVNRRRLPLIQATETAGGKAPALQQERANFVSLGSAGTEPEASGLAQPRKIKQSTNILRVSTPARLAQLLLPAAGPGPPADLHCVLVTNPHSSQWKDPALSQLMCFCRESRYMDQWVPVINLPER
ncbi:PREDICTED: growth arrest and DNA damage-inducible protein GADD45 alpha [Aptenodytes forsteri]|uniref:growth arrest and DNA damage-inducible protein GADD45 alpha n=1 Tax=Aptenodytes forsteri TaxID=9233 RepID=UPI0004F476D1|nr:PREDICTED: growth arrest and DNA damage-inducible protein GADD45 alpha [Aptenodytes forsteri]